MKNLLLFITISTFFFACSLVKNPQSSNFNRVKHHAHLKKIKKGKKTFINTVDSFQKNESVTTSEEASADPIVQEKVAFEKAVASAKVSNNDISKEESVVVRKSDQPSIKLSTMLEDARQFKVNSNNKIKRYEWWEDDPEDWPWGEIILAAIAFLVIVILVIVLVELIGALVSSLLGLIILLLLAYLLYLHWM